MELFCDRWVIQQNGAYKLRKAEAIENKDKLFFNSRIDWHDSAGSVHRNWGNSFAKL
jgi:hypothetical protein